MGRNLAAAALCALAIGTAAAAGHHRLEPILPGTLDWFSPPGNPALEAAWVVGAEGDASLYALRVRLRPGAKIPPHTHPDARYSTVLVGTLHVGFGTVEDPAAMVAVPAGGVYVAPAGQPHYLWARDGEVVYQEAGFGPTATTPAGAR